MGRKRIRIERLPTEPKRKAAYGKRREGILKKAYEISTLCDIQVLYLMFSPAGQLHHFCSQPGIWKILQKFIQNVQNMPEIERANPPFSKGVLKIIDTLAGQQDVANRSGVGVLIPDAPDGQEIKREIMDDEIETMLLQLEKKMMHPAREAFKSVQEFEKLLQGLENVRRMIYDRGERLESQEHSWNTSYNTSYSTQNSNRLLLMQPPQTRIEGGMWGSLQGVDHMQLGVPIFGMDYPSSSSSVPQLMPMRQLQAAPGHGMVGPLQGGDHIQQHEVPIFGQEEQSTSLIMPWQIPIRQPQAPPGYRMSDPPQRREYVQQQEDSAFGMGNLSLSLGQQFSAQQNVHIPASMSGQNDAAQW